MKKITRKLNLILTNDLPLNKPLKFHKISITIRPVFEENMVKFISMFF